MQDLGCMNRTKENQNHLNLYGPKGVGKHVSAERATKDTKFFSMTSITDGYGNDDIIWVVDEFLISLIVTEIDRFRDSFEKREV